MFPPDDGGDDRAAEGGGANGTAYGAAATTATAAPQLPRWKAIYTSVVLGCMLVTLLWDKVGGNHTSYSIDPTSVLLATLTALVLIPDIVPIQEAVAGFANPGVLTVLVLYVVNEGLNRTGVLEWFVSKFLDGRRGGGGGGGGSRGSSSSSSILHHNHPRMADTVAWTQIRVMIPLAVLSTFVASTPIVAAMIPLVQRWLSSRRRKYSHRSDPDRPGPPAGAGRNVPIQQLLIPLSFAVILGGTCSLIGTSTNLVAAGLFANGGGGRDDDRTVGMFDLSVYGVPNALVGMAYILLAAPFLLPGGFLRKNSTGGAGSNGQGGTGGGGGATSDLFSDGENVLLGARVTPWSPGVGRSIKRSGLRDTGGIYLVSVLRASTGHIHRVVPSEFVLNSGDVLYFTGLIESFGAFCDEHCLEIVTNEIQDSVDAAQKRSTAVATTTSIATANRAHESCPVGAAVAAEHDVIGEVETLHPPPHLVRCGFGRHSNDHNNRNELETIREVSGGTMTTLSGAPPIPSLPEEGDDGNNANDGIPTEVGFTIESLLSADDNERRRCISRMHDQIMGIAPASNYRTVHLTPPRSRRSDRSTRRRSKSVLVEAMARMNTPEYDDDDDDNNNGDLRHRNSNSNDDETVLTGNGGGSVPNDPSPSSRQHATNPKPQIVVTIDRDLIVIGIDAPDRPGLLLDISKGLSNLRLELHHTEASVVGTRSVSIWRCEPVTHRYDEDHENDGGGTDGEYDDDGLLPDLDAIWSSLNALLSEDSGVGVIKKRGLRVIRAHVTNGSRLIGKSAVDVAFRSEYKAAIVAIQRGDRAVELSALARTPFHAGDLLVLQASDHSPLLRRPPDGFYDGNSVAADNNANMNTNPPMTSPGLMSRIKHRFSNTEVGGGGGRRQDEDNEEHTDNSIRNVASSNASVSYSETSYYPPLTPTRSHIPDVENVQPAAPDDVTIWRDLKVVMRTGSGVGGNNGGPLMSGGNNNNNNSNRSLHNAAINSQKEFLIAMQVAPRSALLGKSVEMMGIDKLPGLFVVSIDRPMNRDVLSHQPLAAVITTTPSGLNRGGGGGGLAVASGDQSNNNDQRSHFSEIQSFAAVGMSDPLREGDVLWFSGTAESIGDARKIPGLESYHADQLAKMNDNVHDRRLVQAVVARNGPLVHRTVKDVNFRTRYGAAVIAIHRNGKRVHEFPGRVKLQAGDVLLLEAGPTFLNNREQTDTSFALLAEVKDSAPPRLYMLLPTLLVFVAFLAVAISGITTILAAAMGVVCLMIAPFQIVSEKEVIRDALGGWRTYLTTSSAIGIAAMMTSTGIASTIAGAVVEFGTTMNAGGTSIAGIYGCVYILTVLLGILLPNTAAVALVFPIAMDAAASSDLDPRLMLYTVMLSSSSSYVAAFGYETNLMIYGPGGYTSKDFVLFGIPMQIVLWLSTTAWMATASSSSIPWYRNWIIAFIVLIVVVAIRLGADYARIVFRQRQQASVLRQIHSIQSQQQQQQQQGGDTIRTSTVTAAAPSAATTMSLSNRSATTITTVGAIPFRGDIAAVVSH